GQTERRLVPDPVPSVGVGPGAEEQLDDFELSLARGDPEGGDADLVFRIDVGPLVEQPFGSFRVAVSDGRPYQLPGNVVGIRRCGDDYEDGHGHEDGHGRTKPGLTWGPHVVSWSNPAGQERLGFPERSQTSCGEWQPGSSHLTRSDSPRNWPMNASTTTRAS